MPKLLDQAGDTIVEVLLAITVLSAVLGGAYVSANRSLNAIRLAQERSEAVKLVEAQLEQLKATLSVPADGCFTDTDGDCVFSDSGPAYTLSIDEETAPHTYFVARAEWDSLVGIDRDNDGISDKETLDIVYRPTP